MKITVIGVVPPCPRCQRIYDLTVEAVNELGALLVRTCDNTLHRVIAGDIAFGSTGVPE